MSADVVGILLAAGTGSRFGADKLLHPLHDGLPMARHSARSLSVALPRCVAVVRDLKDPVAQRLADDGLAIVACPTAARGMGASIACGVAARPDAAGWLICLADMPFIRSETIAAVAHALNRGAALAAPVHRGRRGHPVGFDRRFRDDLLRLCGDTGARGLLAAHAEQLVLIETDDDGVVRDIDVTEDLADGV